MSYPVLAINQIKELESRDTPETLIARAVNACFTWIQRNYPVEQFPSAGLLVGVGHNGADALGIGCELLSEGRRVLACVLGERDSMKSATLRLLELFEERGGDVHFACDQSLKHAQDTPHQRPRFWIDGLHGFGLNRPLVGLQAEWVKRVQSEGSPVVSLDIPSGLHGDFGLLSDESPHIHATDTLALGALKPVHFLDTCLPALGRLHFIDLNYVDAINSIGFDSVRALTVDDLVPLLAPLRRTPHSHKFKSGRVLVVAGSDRFPGAAVLTCMGAALSGAGMIHALVPDDARHSLLAHTPEIIFERALPSLESFDSIVLGPGWVPAQPESLDAVLSHVMTPSNTCRLLLDAGAFQLLEERLARGERLNERCVLTPHAGEFARLFPEAHRRFTSRTAMDKMSLPETARWAAQMSGAVVYLKGARSCIASPDGQVQLLFNSSPLLAHAGHGDVLAGVLGGFLPRAQNVGAAAACAALLQSSAAITFSEQNPLALTLPPFELARRWLFLRHQAHSSVL